MTLLGHEFADESLLDEALTTPSYRMDVPSARDNQRLEFLGDAVLGLLAAEELRKAFPEEREGPLTIRRTRMVSTAALCDAANRLDFADSLKRNRGAAPLAPHAKTLADAIEAIIGAAYLDGGLPAAREVFATLRLLEQAEENAQPTNPKGDLQLHALAMKPPRLPSYELISTTGKAHEPIFTVRVKLEDVGEAIAEGGNLKATEAKAAAKLLEQIAANAGC